jgi:predicted acyl esterase
LDFVYQGALIVKMCDEFPDGQTRLLSFGVMNLTQYKSNGKPEQLRTGSWYDVTIKLDAIGYKMLHGHKMSVHISTSYWPMIWTPRRCTSLNIRQAHLSIPIIQDLDSCKDTSLYSEPCYGPALKMDILEPASYDRTLMYGLSDLTRYTILKLFDSSLHIDF